MATIITKVDYDVSLVEKITSLLQDFEDERSELENKITEMLDQVSSEQRSLATIKQVNEAQNNLLAIVSNNYGPGIYDMKTAMEDFGVGFKAYTSSIDTILEPRNETVFDFEYKEKIVSFGDSIQENFDTMTLNAQSYKSSCETCQNWIDKFNSYSLKEYEENELDGKDGTHEFSFEQESIRQYESRKRETDALENDIITMLKEKIELNNELEKILGEKEEAIIDAFNTCESSMDEIIDNLNYSINIGKLSLLANKSISNGTDLNEIAEIKEFIEKKLRDKTDEILLKLDVATVILMFTVPPAGLVVAGVGQIVNAVSGVAWGIYYANTDRAEKAVIEFAGATPIDKIVDIGKWGIKIIDKVLDGLDYVKDLFKKIDDDLADVFVGKAFFKNEDALFKANKALEYVANNESWFEVGKSLGLALADGQLSQTEKVSLTSKVIATSKSKEELLAVINEYKSDPVLYNNLFELMVKLS